jgi:DNA helicase-2/ATP-dependent DNA helicase PcrA
MPITDAQKTAAEAQQWSAARDPAAQVRLVAGPGTGKSRTIEKRVLHALESGAKAENVYVISFTRATCAELRERIKKFCAGGPHEAAAEKVHVSTMHSLALGILRRANLLKLYPSDPTVLDDWEQRNVYDDELASMLNSNPTRAGHIRLAHDAQWHTLKDADLAQAQITESEKIAFDAFHGTRTNLYACVLPGEVIFKCVQNFQMGNLPPDKLPKIEHLIVDEFQDLNACDQAFVQMLSGRGAVLFVAGDDDQSIYAFRHADPSGIVNFTTTYPQAKSHDLKECFRCTSSVLKPALSLITHNPGRLPKDLASLYDEAAPPVGGTLHVWSFASAQAEARAIAESCRELLAAGMAGREDEILILLAQQNPAVIQLDPITRELSNLGLPFRAPSGPALTEDPALRAVYSILRLVLDRESESPDYLAHRDLLSLLSGVGTVTATGLSEDCIAKNQNYRALFYQAAPPQWLKARAGNGVARVKQIIEAVSTWKMSDTVAMRLGDIGGILSKHVFTAQGQSAGPLAIWINFAGTLPQEMTLAELWEFFGAYGVDQQSVMERVQARLGAGDTPQETARKIRILTMHGAKGLNGKVVFIPSACQEIIPSKRSLQAPGLVMEQRRLFYVSITRAMAACIVSHSTTYTGAAAQALAQQSVARFTRSQFLNEMGVPSQSRGGGLSKAEAKAIVDDIQNM